MHELYYTCTKLQAARYYILEVIAILMGSSFFWTPCICHFMRTDYNRTTHPLDIQLVM